MSRSYEKRAARSATHALVFAALTVGLVASCGDDSGGKDNVDGGPRPGPDGSILRDGAAADAQVAIDGATPDGGKPDASTVDAGKGAAPVLTMATARQAGRTGADLRIDFSASDTDKDIRNVVVEVFKADGTQIGAKQEVPLGAPIAGTSGESWALFEGLLDQQDAFDKAKVSLVDGRGVASEVLDVTVTKQPIVSEGASCDATFAANRCAPGFGCKGAAAATKCTAGEPPTLAAVGYFRDELGGRVVLKGTDPDGDVASFTITFLGANDMPLLVDLDGEVSDTIPPTSTFTKEVTASGSVDFYYRFTLADSFSPDVAKVSVTVSDSRATNNVSNVKTAAREATPIKTTGATCDPNPAGFDYCKGTPQAPLVCATTGAASKCTAVKTARMNACNAALLLDPASGKSSVTGKISASLWDAPAGCSGGTEVTSRPDSLVQLVLKEAATKVTLTTDFPYTTFDTVLYALTACDAVPTVFDPRVQDSTDLWCTDDQAEVAGEPKNTHGILELMNLAAGSYFIVVDSASIPEDTQAGALFQLNVTVE